MQVFNKGEAKKIFAHTWFIYPLLIGLISVVWIWGFQAFHLPSSHQMLVIFFASNVKDNSFISEIQNTYYEKENLREVDISYSLPTTSGYYEKLKVYLQKSDILVLDQKTIDDYKGYQDYFFTEMNDDLITKYELDSYEFYNYVDSQNVNHRYGIKIKSKDVEGYLDNYMAFDPNFDYYIMLSTSSKNLGYLSGENNASYDNAITYMKHLLEK